MCLCVSCLRTSCLVPLDFRLGSRTGQTEEKGGEGARGRGDCRGVQLIGWKERGRGGIEEGICQVQDGGGWLRYENGHSRCP